MLIKSKAIILKTYPYGDSGLIVKMFTEQLGLMSFLAMGVKKSNSKNAHSLFMPLQLVEIVFYKKESEQLQKIKEVAVYYQPNDKYILPQKMGIVMFMSEVIIKSVHEHHIDEKLYVYLDKVIKELDEVSQISNFPIKFLTDLLNLLGVKPKLNYSEEYCYFNIHDGHFQSQSSTLKHVMDKRLSECLNNIYFQDGFVEKNNMSYIERTALLDHLILYLKTHALHNKSINSIEVLHSIMN
jgi:DNA repair protein RecO (recombination protein O)